MNESSRGLRNVGVQTALLSAVLFGASAPLSKLLLGEVSPWLLAGLLYVGAGLGMSVWRLARRAPRVLLPRGEVPWLLGAVAAGGVAGPVLLMFGLSSMPASGASLLLNAEGVLTAVIAWVVFREPADRRVVLGMVAIVAGAVIIAVPTAQAEVTSVWPALAILAACACWALDNNLTRKVSLTDATWLVMVKGAVAGPTNLVLALLLGATLPEAGPAGAAMALGFVSYGLSMVFIVGLRHVGTARAGAYFSIAPFFGALLAIALGEAVTWQLLLAGGLMALGTWLHLTENHGHEHTHEPITHEHWHTHDDGHHDHAHDPGELVAAGVRHRHLHTHEPVTHGHEHYPDTHHRHTH